MKTLLTLLVIVISTLFAPVSNANTFPGTGYAYAIASGGGCFINASVPLPGGAFPISGNLSTSTESWGACAGHAYTYRHNGPPVRFYWPSGTFCPANSTISGTVCSTNPGYEAVPDGSGGWNVVPVAPPQCPAWQTLNIATGQCEAMNCPEGTYYSGTLQQCTARDPIGDCNLGEQIALTVPETGPIPMFQDAYGCSWSIDESIPEANRRGCVQTPDGKLCTGWYTNSGNSAVPNYCEQNPTLCEEPYPGSNPDSGGTPGGGSGNPDPGSPSNPDNPGPGGSDGSGSGGDDGQPTLCERDPRHPDCREPGDEPGEDDWHRPGYGTGQFGDLSNDVQLAKDRLYNRFNTIKQQIGGMFRISMPAGAALPCESVNLGAFGTFKICISDYSEQLQQVGQIILAVGTILAVFIILG